MMKYAVNHPRNFKNVHTGFFMGFLLAFINFLTELTVILVLLSLPNILEVVMKYVSLMAVSNVPRFYFNSIVEHKLLNVVGIKLPITNHRHKTLK